MTELANKAALQAAKADLSDTIADVMADLTAATDKLEAAIEAQTWRLTVRLGGILIAMGLVIFASVPFLIP
jgi:CHASE3 domain sensor protein